MCIQSDVFGQETVAYELVQSTSYGKGGEKL